MNIAVAFFCGVIAGWSLTFMLVLASPRFIMNTGYSNSKGQPVYVDGEHNYWHLEKDGIKYTMHGQDEVNPVVKGEPK